MASEMEFSQHNKVKRRSSWHGPMVLVLLFFVVILVMSLAFRVSKIEVINASEYTDEEIISASRPQSAPQSRRLGTPACCCATAECTRRSA